MKLGKQLVNHDSIAQTQQALTDSERISARPAYCFIHASGIFCDVSMKIPRPCKDLSAGNDRTSLAQSMDAGNDTELRCNS